MSDETTTRKTETKTDRRCAKPKKGKAPDDW